MLIWWFSCSFYRGYFEEIPICHPNVSKEAFELFDFMFTSGQGKLVNDPCTVMEVYTGIPFGGISSNPSKLDGFFEFDILIHLSHYCRHNKHQVLLQVSNENKEFDLRLHSARGGGRHWWLHRTLDGSLCCQHSRTHQQNHCQVHLQDEHFLQWRLRLTILSSCAKNTF